MLQKSYTTKIYAIYYSFIRKEEYMRMKMYTIIAALAGFLAGCGDSDEDTGSSESEDTAVEEAEEQE